MPNPRQMEKLAATVQTARVGDLPPADPLPEEYWGAVLADPRSREAPHVAIAACRISEITSDTLRVSCRRCGRLVEIGTADAARLYSRDARLNDVGRRLLNANCQSRTGRYEEDGCWPAVETR